jgi:hypothetical protein
VLEFGVKVGIGAKKTGYVPIDSVSEAYGKDIKDLRKVPTTACHRQPPLPHGQPPFYHCKAQRLVLFKAIDAVL